MGSYRSATIYTLHIRLEHIEPLIWRRVIVPGQISLYKLHQFLQVIMGWENYHLHMFYIGEKQYGEPDPDYDDIVIKRDKHALFYAVAPVEGYTNEEDLNPEAIDLDASSLFWTKFTKWRVKSYCQRNCRTMLSANRPGLHSGRR